MIEKLEGGGTVITGDDVITYRTLAIRRGLILKIDTGMSLTRVSTLSAAQRSGLTSKRTYRGALKDVNRWLAERNVPAVWSKTYPKG